MMLPTLPLLVVAVMLAAHLKKATGLAIHEKRGEHA